MERPSPLLSVHAGTLVLLLMHTVIGHGDAQGANSNTTSFSCSMNSSEVCKTYVVYRAQPPGLLDTGRISDLFGVSRLSIQRANNLSYEDATYLPGSPLLVPISCGCSGDQFFANISYQIKSGDSFYMVSTGIFENLTDYHAVEDGNPTLEPTRLAVGQDVTFPLHCKCPTKAQTDRGINFLLTYVWQHGDDISKLSSVMNTSSRAILTENNYRNLTAAVASPILIPVSQLPTFRPPLNYNTATSSHEQQRPPKLVKTIIILSSMLGVALALASWFFFIFLYCKCNQNKTFARTDCSMETTNLLRCEKGRLDFISRPSNAAVDKLLLGISTCLDNPILYDIKAIMQATRNLDDRYRIGGYVYKATLDAEVLAVKKAKGDVAEELTILQKLSHANLVKLRGVSADAEGNFFVVYEYAENGSLDQWLSPIESSFPSSVGFLSWRQRLNIAVDVANGLQYIHSHTRPSIVHRDIRTSNILLNDRFKAKISNFSRAKPATVSLTPTIDVFGFGVFLLELLSGKRDTTAANREGGETSVLWKEIRTILQVEEKREERLRKWMDPSLKGLYAMEGALSMAAMARACTSEKASERPCMSEIVFGLSVLAQSHHDESEKGWTSNSELNLAIATLPVAR